MSLLYGVTGTTNLAATAAALSGQGPSLVLVLAVVLVGAGMGFKIAAVPFHMWAPDVYEGAPTPVTAFLSVGSKAASSRCSSGSSWKGSRPSAASGRSCSICSPSSP